MSKLYKLKKWLTLDEAITHISNLIGESISLSELYQLAADGHIRLSVKFVNGAKAKKVRLIRAKDVKYKQLIPKNIPDFPKDKCFRVPIKGYTQISGDLWAEEVVAETYSISGVWDLAMVGAEQADIADRYYQTTSDHAGTIPRFVGHYLQKDGETYQLQVRRERLSESDEYNSSLAPDAQDENEKLSLQEIRLRLKRPYRPPQYSLASKLDDHNNILVISTSEINRFIYSLEDKPKEAKSLHSKERTTLLLLLGTILKKANFDLQERGVVGKIRRATELNNTPISEQTIRDLIPHILYALELKQNS
ncbi:hypothetical protein [Shewanella sp.]|uniref:hypothetical protein n=1 Tax=Shewanella sp. TaxID=50422 RepID=UPI001B4258EF|nr:hypothetical protein [Shewanella sp.]MBP6518814.1 hypothetical protein [Shewanella sp.]